jgi:hypothetical protein
VISLKDTTYPDIKKEVAIKEIFDCFTPREDEIERFVAKRFQMSYKGRSTFA